MAQKGQAFPKLPEKQWWAIRDRFRQTMPTRVTPSYLATILGIKENSAKANILPGLEAVGLVDAEGTPTELARRWRDDADYPDVVKEIRENVYPDELLDALPDPKADRQAVERWFASRTGHGMNAAAKMGQLYELLSDGDPVRGQKKPKRAASKAPARPRNERREPPPAASPETSTQRARKPASPQSGGEYPAVYINLQVHISADASSDQVDHIFASMAKHLYQHA